jgi:histone deacetylase complex regulatory component SIN3
MSDTLTSIENAVSSKAKKIKLPSKRVLLLVVSGLFVLAVLSTSIALYQHSQNVKASQAAAARQDALAAQKATTDQINKLKAQVATLTAQKQAACANYKNLATARATRSLVVIPTAVGCTNP